MGCGLAGWFEATSAYLPDLIVLGCLTEEEWVTRIAPLPPKLKKLKREGEPFEYPVKVTPA